MFIYQETDNTTIRARIGTNNIIEDLERCDEIIYHNVGIEKIIEEEELETKAVND